MYGVVIPPTLALTEGKSSFTPVVTVLTRGAIVQVLADAGDGWASVRDLATNAQGLLQAVQVTLSQELPTTSDFTSYIVVTNVAGARLRAGAGVQFPIITTLKQGETLRVIAEEGDWLQVSFENRAVFISAHLTQRKETVADTTRFLGEEPDLLTIEPRPTSQIPTADLVPKTRTAVAAEVWNTYGGLIELLAKRLQIPVATMVAVIGAESAGKAFGDDGRLLVRFEVHLFQRFWGEANKQLFERHFQCESFRNHRFRANPDAAWGAVHSNQTREWDVLTFARGLDESAALSSISMGAPQIMGFNFKRIGYETVQEMFDQFSRSAHAQILGMFDFVRGGSSISQGIRALQNGDFLTFASLYNGSGNAHTYESIISDYVDLFNALIPTAVDVAAPDHQRGPQNLPVEVAAPSKKELENANAPASVTITDTIQPQIAAVSPAVSDTSILATLQLNIRAQPSLTAKLLGTLEKGAPIALTEPLESALAKIAQPPGASQFLEIVFNGQPAFAAAWLTTPSKVLTDASINTYIDGLPERPLPAGYHAFWAQAERLGLPDPFDSLPVRVASDAELVNMQVNGFGPNTFAMFKGAQWYSRIGFMHNGYDFICKTGTPLIALSDGVIIKNWVFMANKAEKTVVLWCYLPERFRDAQGRRMMSNVLIAMGHLSNGSVRKQLEVVSKGDVIGYTGTPAGSNVNDHLHYEIHLINGDPSLPNPRTSKMLSVYKGDQNAGNNTPWNALMFYSPRILRYNLQQGESIGWLGKFPEYPTDKMLKDNGSAHLAPLDPFALAYYRYGIPNVWKPTSGRRFPVGVVATSELEGKLASIPTWTPVSSTFG